MIRNEKCEVLDKQNFEPKYRRFTIQFQINKWLNEKEGNPDQNCLKLKTAPLGR
jgi:hypothetical protein